jgi:hypothetical protein
MKTLVSFTLTIGLGLPGAVMAEQTSPVQTAPMPAQATPVESTSPALTEQEILVQLQSQGYTKVHDLAFHDGMWRAHATSGDGRSVTVRIDPATGKAFSDKPVSRLNEDEVRASLTTQGYTDVHDVDFEDGVWDAKARNAAGKRVKLKVDPQSGRVVSAD